MIDEHFQLDTFTPPLHTILGDVRKLLNQLFETFQLQFLHDETSVGTTHLTKMQIGTGDSEPASQRPYPIVMKYYAWVISKINKLLDAQASHLSHSSWIVPTIAIPKGDGGKCLVIDYRV